MKPSKPSNPVSAWGNSRIDAPVSRIMPPPSKLPEVRAERRSAAGWPLRMLWKLFSRRRA